MNPALSNVAPLRAPGYLLDEARACLTPTMKTRTFSRNRLLDVWKDHIKRAGGEESLLAALKRYLREDKDVARTGGPGLQVWLRAGRYEHWLEAPGGLLEAPAAFGNPQVWTAIVDTFGEPWAKSYVLPYEWDAEGSRLIVPRTRLTAIDKLKEQASKLKACGVMGIKLAD